MKRCIADTNVLIDLCNCGALSGFLGLGDDICTTDLVMHEIAQPGQRSLLEAEVRSGRLKALTLSGDEIAAAAALPTAKNLKRITDKTLLLKASAMICCLLTGDRDLRAEAENRKIEVHGSLWAFRQLLGAGIARPQELRLMLEKLAQSNPRLPSAELEKLNLDIEQTI